MKFFSELGSCYRPSALPAVDEPNSTTQLPVTGNGSDHGTSSKRSNELAPPTRSKSTAHWKPALAVISEDGFVSVGGSERKAAAKSENKLPSKSRSMTRARCFRSNDDCSRKRSMPMIIPAFSPTPFMF